MNNMLNYGLALDESPSDTLAVVYLIALLVTLVLTVLSFVFFVPEKRGNKMKGFGKFLHNTFCFKYLVVEKILQAIYIFSTIGSVIVGIIMLVTAKSSLNVLEGLLVMILFPIAIRLSFELMMLGILLVKNVISINAKLKNQFDADPEEKCACRTEQPTETIPEAPAPIENPEDNTTENN